MGMIRAAGLGYEYLRYEEEGQEPEATKAIEDVSLEIQKGQFIAVLGHNGSGKSTLAKHINALLVPTEGTMWVDDMKTSDEEDVWKIRQKAGMVFQNPDNQIIGNVVEEDVGFGPENLGVPTDEIWKPPFPEQALRRPETARRDCGRNGHAAGMHRPRRADRDAGPERTKGSSPRGAEAERGERRYGHSDYALHGRGRFCGPRVRHGRRKTGNAGDAAGDFLGSGKIKRTPPRRTPGDTVGL